MTRRLMDAEPLTAQIPADVDQPDKIIYGLNARQVVILAATGLVTALGYSLLHALVPFPVTVAALFPMLVFGVVVTLARRDGMSLDRFALAALLHARAAKQLVRTEGPVSAPPAWCRMRGQLPAPLRLPVRAVRQDGVLEFTGGGVAAVVQAGTVSFGLRTTSEQAALVAAFGRWLNSLETPVQILLHTRPVDLSGLADHITRAAPALPDPALEQAATDHAAYLQQVNASVTLLARQVLIVIRDAPGTAPTGLGGAWGGRRRGLRRAGAAVVLRRAEEAVRALGVLGIGARVLDADACAQMLAEALSPGRPPLTGTAHPDEVITGLEESR
ncbi:PrgI family protein [Actinomadura gamaensis]|uniref:PrgI family protein n=1 Tax=Actinomadura gamaensis TaxID=1763541 RepID=A0ABV9U6V9_9ACTN